jgi:hypothetical protein
LPHREQVWRSRGIPKHFPNLGTRLREVVSFKFHPLYSWGRSPWYLSDRRLCGPQSHSSCCGEEKILLPQPGIESHFLGRPTQRLGHMWLTLYPLIRIIILYYIHWIFMDCSHGNNSRILKCLHLKDQSVFVSLFTS